VFDLWVNDRTVGRYKRRFYKREGKKKCFFAGYNSGNFDDDPEFAELDCTFSRKGGKKKKTKPLKLKGPPDIVNRESFKKILHGEPLDYPFLTAFENELLMLRALGCSWKRLARKYSGGHKRRSYNAKLIKNILHDCYDKIRINERAGSVPIHIQFKSVFKKYSYRLKRSKNK
jgi:hypothetical protein